jgi:ATP-binding cassette subfamily F protein uup
VVTQTIASEGNGLWKEYAGGYEDWLRCRREIAIAAKPGPSKSDETKPAPKTSTNKLTWKEQRELEALPERISQLEAEQTALTGRLGESALHTREPQEAARIASRLGEIETALLELLERWEALESRTSA